MKAEDFFNSKTLFRLSLGTAAVLLLAIVFAAGVFVGLEKARFSYRWGDDHFLRAEAGRPPHPGFLDNSYFNGHGAVGVIGKISGGQIFVTGVDENEKIINLEDNTIIRKGRLSVKLGDLKVNDKIAVIGDPQDDGSIGAKLIHVLEPAFPGSRN